MPPDGMGNPAESKTLWMGQIQQNWDEPYVTMLFEPVARPTAVKIMRYAGTSSGYAFVDFATHEDAKNVLETFSNQRIPNSNLTFKLNWGAGSGRKPFGSANEFSLFVGDLPTDVNDAALFQAFSSQYPACTSAKVVMDAYSGTSKGYGFVRFSDKAQCDAAIAEMNGTTIGGRQVRVSHATAPTRRHSGFHMNIHGAPMSAMPMQYQYGMAPYPNQTPLDGRQTNGYRPPGSAVGSGSPWMGVRPTPAMPDGGPPLLVSTRTSEESSSPELASLPSSMTMDAASLASFNAAVSPENTTVFVGNLDPAVSETQLQQHFQAFGNIVQVKIPPNRGCGFVKFDSHDSAEKALTALNGSTLCNQRIRLDWGKANAYRQQAMMAAVDPAMGGYAAAAYNPYYVNAWQPQYYYRGYGPQYMLQAQTMMQQQNAGRFPQDAGGFPPGAIPVLTPQQMGMDGMQGQLIDEGSGLADYATVNSALSAQQGASGLWNGVMQG